MNEVSEDAESEDILTLGQETTSYYGWLNILCYNVGLIRLALVLVAFLKADSNVT